jgi:hypothetical protein
MNVGRMLALVFAVSIALSALSGTTNPASAQGPAVDTPSGYALTPVGGESEPLTLPTFAKGLRFIPAGHSPLLPGFLAWMPARPAPAASSRFSAVSGNRRTVPGPANRQRIMPGGR